MSTGSGILRLVLIFEKKELKSLHYITVLLFSTNINALKILFWSNGKVLPFLIYSVVVNFLFFYIVTMFCFWIFVKLKYSNFFMRHTLFYFYPSYLSKAYFKVLNRSFKPICSNILRSFLLPLLGVLFVVCICRNMYLRKNILRGYSASNVRDNILNIFL